MFYLLIIVGIILIVAGIYKDKGKISFFTPEGTKKDIEFNELNHLKVRLENIENILFSSDPIMDLEVSFEEIVANTEINEDPLTTYKIIRKYEKENYSLEEICSLMGMKKGEVLLLKNLYKNYPL